MAVRFESVLPLSCGSRLGDVVHHIHGGFPDQRLHGFTSLDIVVHGTTLPLVSHRCLHNITLFANFLDIIKSLKHGRCLLFHPLHLKFLHSVL